jgi:N4-(beta-N-acetylglucosaminyl)-L-asparaginase
MSSRTSKVNRRDFVRRGVALGAGALTINRVAAGKAPAIHVKRNGRAETPIIVTSHTNETGQNAMRSGWEIIASGGRALDAVEKAANVIEVDPEDMSVGYGGLPNEDGVVQLDASIMDGRTYSAGSVASLENIKTPSSVARLVMERTDHVMLVGPGALAFARSFGFKEENLLTEASREIWLRWREEHSDRDDYGPPDHLKKDSGDAMNFYRYQVEHHYGTTNVLSVDANGDIAGITTTSGLSWKIPGRIGDSPIIGAGLYVDNQVGAAGATGRGEDVIKSCASYYIVMRMRAGRSPQEACEDALELIVGNYKYVNLDFVPGEKFVAINKAGEVGCASMGGGVIPPSMSVHRPSGLEIVEGTAHYPVRRG